MKITSKVLASAFIALTFVAVPACDDKKEDKKGDKKDAKGDKKDEKKADKKEDKKADAKADAKADGGDAKADAKADGGEPAAADGGGDAAAAIGVPECDEYIKNYTKCIEEKMTGPAKDTSLQALKTSAEAWKKAAATPAGKEGLATACKTAAEAVKSSCGW